MTLHVPLCCTPSSVTSQGTLLDVGVGLGVGVGLSAERFSATNVIPQLLCYALFIAFSLWLLILVLRIKQADEMPAGQDSMG